MKLFFFILTLLNLSLSFDVFKNTHYTNQPSSFLNYGIQDLWLATTGAMWASGEDMEELPKYSRIFNWVNAINKMKSNRVVIDVEHWNDDIKGDDIAQGEDCIDKLITIADMFRDAGENANHSIIIGYYAVMPMRDYWTPAQNITEDVEKWKTINRRMLRLSEHVDDIYPSLYTFYNSTEGNAIYVRGNLKEAKVYGKKTYAYLWPQFHDSNPELGGQFLRGYYWKQILEICLEYANGIVIWGGGVEWDESLEWWQETLLFMEKLKCNGKIIDACSGNGECLNNVCNCFEGWQGSNCDIKTWEVVVGTVFGIIGGVCLVIGVVLCCVFFLVVYVVIKKKSYSQKQEIALEDEEDLDDEEDYEKEE